jgi:hypothetical protein
MAAVAAQMVSANSVQTSGPLTWEIPVRITVFRKNDGSGWSINYNENFMDGFLSNMNTQLTGGPNTFHFFRCGPINFIDVDQLYSGLLTVSDFSYNRNYLNLYLYGKPSQAPSATFPWDPEPKAVYMTSGLSSTSDAVGFHELGHTLGLLHTFSPEVAYTVPVTPSQQDYPENQGGREIMITDVDPNKQFQPNGDYTGDRVADTPPGCDDTPARAAMYPSSATIAGCLDSDPNTPCANGCLDGNPNTPCINGCSWDFANCTYTGDYRDYNFDLIVDSLNILARNFMSYTFACANDFTPGQVKRADDLANFFLNDYYEENLCGNLLDRVEIEGSNVGLTRVNVRISPTSDPADFTQTIVNTTGDFSGKLPSSTFSTEVKADIKRFRSTDVTKLDNNWVSGLDVMDLICISRHILGLDTLDGYKLLAADANKSNTVTTFDIVTFRKLILGSDTALSAYASPWRFIPEVVTQKATGGGLQPDFDGLGIDHPFATTAPAMGSQIIAPTQYCEPTWPFLMKSNTVRNGFDAVKLGNICGPVVPGLTGDDCPGEVALLVPDVALSEGSKVELSVKGYKFQSVAAFQAGFKASKEDFEYVSAISGLLDGFSPENALGGINHGKDNIKVVWLDENLTPKTLADGSELFKITLKALHDIPDLSQVITLDKSVLDTYFLSNGAGCKGDASLEIGVKILEGVDGRNSGGVTTPSRVSKLFCVPNPATERLTVLFDSPQEFDGNVFIHDMQGRLLSSQRYGFTVGRNVIEIRNMAQLPSGMLNISIFDGRELHKIRVEKQ